MTEYEPRCAKNELLFVFCPNMAPNTNFLYRTQRNTGKEKEKFVFGARASPSTNKKVVLGEVEQKRSALVGIRPSCFFLPG